MTSDDDHASSAAPKQSPSASETLEYIAELVDELCSMARNAGQATLAELLSIARDRARQPLSHLDRNGDARPMEGS